MSLNPLFGIVTAYRSAILGIDWDFPCVAISSAVALGGFLFGMLYFRQDRATLFRFCVRRDRFIRQWQQHCSFTLIEIQRSSMSKPIITCDSLGKSYRLGEKQRIKPLYNHSFTMREAMTKTIDSGIRFLKGESQEAARRDSTFWRSGISHSRLSAVR